jgi:hypothetical protein
MLATNTQTTREVVASATTLMDEVISAMRRRAAQLSKQRARRARTAMPPPVASLLNGFSRALADRIAAISAALPDEIRERLRVISPGFISATLANDPDVVQLFVMLLAAEPVEAARWLVEQVDLLEQRFAS